MPAARKQSQVVTSFVHCVCSHCEDIITSQILTSEHHLQFSVRDGVRIFVK